MSFGRSLQQHLTVKNGQLPCLPKCPMAASPMWMEREVQFVMVWQWYVCSSPFYFLSLAQDSCLPFIIQSHHLICIYFNFDFYYFNYYTCWFLCFLKFFFFNFVSQYFILFNFYIQYNPYYFDCCLFYHFLDLFFFIFFSQHFISFNFLI